MYAGGADHAPPGIPFSSGGSQHRMTSQHHAGGGSSSSSGLRQRNTAGANNNDAAYPASGVSGSGSPVRIPVFDAAADPEVDGTSAAGGAGATSTTTSGRHYRADSYGQRKKDDDHDTRFGGVTMAAKPYQPQQKQLQGQAEALPVPPSVPLMDRRRTGDDNGSAIGGRAGSILGGRAGSVHSKGSGTKASGTSATSVTEILRRGIALRSVRMEGSLLRLRRAIIAVFILVAAMNIASLVVSTSL